MNHRTSRATLFFFAFVLLMVALFIGLAPDPGSPVEVKYNEFVEDVKKGRVREVVVCGQDVRYATVTDETRITKAPVFTARFGRFIAGRR